MERVSPAHIAPSDLAWSGLMAAAQAGDRQAYDRLLRDCIPHIKRVARRTGVRPESLDDVVQDVLITVHRARHTYDPSRSFAHWLGAIAQRRAIDHLRHRGRQERREISDDLAYDAFPDAGTTPEGALERDTREREMRGAVAALSPGQREAVELLAVRQRSLAEAAAETGKTKGALKVNLHRALKTLRARFDGAE
ncbi:RNA polymerase sigma factor [Lichenibacterium ramalinae]|nr:sigma-70 family RNA polymerase sigma factor [Lichenibacterium ramalinae]